MGNKILTKAKSNKGMQEAAQGEITMTDVEAEMTAESATKAPTEAPTMAPTEGPSGDGSGDGTSTASPDGNGVDDDGTSTFLSTTPAGSPDNGDSTAVDAVGTINAFSGVLFGVVAVVMQ